MSEVQVKTPCIGVCSTGIGDRVCRGCKRFAHEVIHWNSYTGEQKQLIEQRLADFLSRCVQNKLQVTDSQRLRSQLDAWRVPRSPGRDVNCWAYSLLKAGASQIEEPEECGLKIDAEFRHLPLAELRLMIDEEFFILSDAWYERYVGSAENA